MGSTPANPNITHVKEAQSTLMTIHKISQLLNTGLSPEALTVCVRLCEQGVNPEALASLVRDLQQEVRDHNSSQVNQVQGKSSSSKSLGPNPNSQ